MNRSGQLPNLDKLFKDEDEQDFKPLAGSNLASLFDNSNLKKHELIPSLKPHPTNKVSNDKSPLQPQPANKTEVIVAKVVHAYKLQNGQYTLIGKLGFALTGNVATNTYALILYKNKSERISVTKLTLNFSYSLRENNYATYNDNGNENWSILFENSEASIEFAREIGLSKYLLREDKSGETIPYQDLTVSGENEEAKVGDRVLVKCFIMTNIIQPLKISTALVQETEVEITTDDNWERSLIGAKKNSRRILFLSPGKQISLGPGFPRDKDIALEIEIIDIIQVPSPSPTLYSGKASLISRIAKMGQSILPKLPSTTATDSEDTEEEIQIKSPRRLRSVGSSEIPVKSPQNIKAISPIEQLTDTPISTGPTRILQQNAVHSPVGIVSSHRAIVPTVPYTNTWTTGPIQQQYLSTLDGQLYPFQPALPQTLPATVDPNINVFLSETRTHNAEIRMGMSKIADNVQKLLDKFHVIEVQNAASPNSEKTLESSLKMFLALRNEKSDINTTDMLKNSKGNELFNADVAKEEIRRLEESLNTTKKSLTETSHNLETVEAEKRNIIQEKLELEEKIRRLESSLNEAQTELQKTSSDLKNAKDSIMNHQRDNATLEAKIITLNARTKVLEDTSAAIKNMAGIQQDKTMEIKQIMNKTYQTLIGKFTDVSYSSDYIRMTVAKTIKAITLQVLNEDRRDIQIHPPKNSSPKESSQSSNVIERSEDEPTAPPIADINPIHEINSSLIIPAEPPPVPPMDLDVDREWSL